MDCLVLDESVDGREVWQQAWSAGYCGVAAAKGEFEILLWGMGNPGVSVPNGWILAQERNEN